MSRRQGAPGNQARHGGQPVSSALVLLAVLATLYTFYFARVVLVPVVMALMLHLLLSPLVGALARRGIHPGFSATVLLALILATLVGAGTLLAEPAREWLQEAPVSLRQLARNIEEVKAPLKDIQQLEDQVNQMAEIDGGGAQPQQVEIRNPKLFEQMMQGLPAFLAALLITFLIAFFLLVTGDRLAHRLIGFGRTWPARRAIIKASRDIRGELSHYLRTVTLINLALGTAVGIALWLLGVPNPELWGAMVAVLNFAPYIGAITSALVLGVVGIVTFPDVGMALSVPGVFIALTSLEGMVLTPLILGRRLSLNPLVVFLSVFFWGWLWGVPGALVAVPLMSSLKVALSHAASTRRFARLLQD